MALFFSMLPFYLIGNLHCLGMCGPLVMMIGRHRYRYAYFVGRLLSFGFMAMAAGEAGAVLQDTLHKHHLPEFLTFGLGFFMLGIAVVNAFPHLMHFRFPSIPLIQKFSHSISLLMLKDTVWTTFLFGASTVMLPCGQTLIVFSACALVGSAWIGLFNGLAFALLTSPSLWIAMSSLRWFQEAKMHQKKWTALAAGFAGAMAICRGLADMGTIPHLSWGTSPYHLVLF